MASFFAASLGHGAAPVVAGVTMYRLPDALSRDRFIALLGLAVSALMALAIAAQWFTAAFIASCVR